MSTKKEFPIAASIQHAWQLFKQRPWFWIGVGAFVLLVNVGLSFVDAGTESDALIGPVTSILTTIIQWWVNLGMLIICLRACDGQQPEFKDLFVDNWSKFWNYILGSLVYSLMLFGYVIVVFVVGGLLALLIVAAMAMLMGFSPLLFLMWPMIIMYGLIIIGIIIGITYLSVKYHYFMYCIAEHDLQPFESMYASGRLTNGYKWKILALFVVLGCINLVGIVALGVGLFIAMPVSVLASVYVYKWLSDHMIDSTAELNSEQNPVE